MRSAASRRSSNRSSSPGLKPSQRESRTPRPPLALPHAAHGRTSRRHPLHHRGSFLFVLPAVVILGGFGLAASFSNVVYSFLDWNVLTPPRFVFLDNYKKVFQDDIGLRSIINTFYYAFLYVVPTVVCSLLVALALNERSRIMYFFRTVFYVPVVTSYVVVLVIWSWIYDFDIGLLNSYLGDWFGVQKIGWLINPFLALPSLVVISIWKNMGYTVIIYLAGLQNVEETLMDAGRIDGCNNRQLFWHVIIPQLHHTTTLAIVLVTTASFQMFVQPYLLTQGGPDNTTSTIAYYFYKQAFSAYKVGYGSTIAVVAVAIFVVVITLERRLLASRE